MIDVPDDLNVLSKISDEDIASGRHSLARCQKYGCRSPVRYSMTIEEWPEGYGYYNTAFYCEEHKPEIDTPPKRA